MFGNPIYQVSFSNGYYSVFRDMSLSDVVSECSRFVGDSDTRYHITSYQDWIAYLAHILID